MHEGVLKGIVIGLGLLIVVTLGGLIYLAATQDSTRSPSEAYVEALEIPAGYSVIGEQLGEDRLLVILGRGESRLWLVIDLASGEVVGRLRSRPE